MFQLSSVAEKQLVPIVHCCFHALFAVSVTQCYGNAVMSPFYVLINYDLILTLLIPEILEKAFRDVFRYSINRKREILDSL